MAICNLHCVNPREVDLILPLTTDMIHAAMAKTNISDFLIVIEDVRHGRALMWVATNGNKIQATAVTQISKANGHKYCTIVACAGVDRDEWMPLLEEIENYARNENCAAMRFFGRNGWSRLLPDYKIIGHIGERKLA
jgi:hypothetical protein